MPEEPVLLSLFTIPKPFEGHIGIIQTNALRSWRRLGPKLEVLVMGDEPGTKEICTELGIHPFSSLKLGSGGVPLLDHAFQLAHEHATGHYLCYINSDILLFEDLFASLESLINCHFSDFLAIGRRIDCDIHEKIDLESTETSHQFLSESKREGKMAASVCKDFFLFPRHLFANIPPFLVGRGNWDNWMVAEAKRMNIPVIDITKRSNFVHQNHGYQHLPNGRFEAYITGAGAQHNQRVAGGSNVVTGGSANWELSENGELRRLGGGNWLRFLLDTPRLARLFAGILRHR